MFAALCAGQLKPEAKERQKRKSNSVKGMFPEQKAKTQSRDQAAKKFGIGGRTVSEAQNVIEASCKEQTQTVLITLFLGLIDSATKLVHNQPSNLPHSKPPQATNKEQT